MKKKLKKKKTRKKPTEKFVNELRKIVNKIEKTEDFDFEANGVDRKKVKQFGIDRTIKIEAQEMPIQVIEIVRPKYKDKDKIYQAPMTDVFPHSVLTPSFAANIITAKYQLSIPLNRYSDYLKACGIKIPANNLSNYVGRAAEKLVPIYERIAEVVSEAVIRHIDETTIEVLDSEKEKCYMFVYRTSTWEKIQASLYIFSETRKTDNVEKMLEDKKGYAVVDAYARYDKLAKEGIKLQRCWVHIRRKFVDCIKALSAAERKTSSATEVIELINKLFKKEKWFKENKKTASEIKKIRNEKEYQEILKKIDEKIMVLDKATEINTNLRKAINYYLNIKDKGELYTFLENGKIEIDNNLAERTVKPLTIGRKNYLFCKTVRGADVLALMYSIVQTAINNTVVPEKYIKYVLEKIDKINTTNKEELEKIMPWDEEIQKQFGFLKDKNPGHPEEKVPKIRK